MSDLEKGPKFEKYKKYAKKKGKLVTKLPVVLDINPNMKTKNAKAKILKYSKPRQYKIVFAGTFYKNNRYNDMTIENIIEHELAHIKHPIAHGLGFMRAAKKLGAPKRYQKAR